MIYNRLLVFIRVLKKKREVEGLRFHLTAYMGKNSHAGNFSKLHKNSKLLNSSLGDYSYLGESTVVGNSDIGKFCSIAHECLIGGMGMHPVDRISTHPIFYAPPGPLGISFTDIHHFDAHARTKIGNDVWIGARAIILDGLIIGDGAIIAAGAVVTKNIAPYTIVGGVPARTIRQRFNNEEVARLLDLRWWDWTEDKLREYAEQIRSTDLTGVEN